MYKLLYNPNIPINRIIDPVWGTTENYLKAANKIFNEKCCDFQHYSEFEKDIFSNLVRLNWMCADLKLNPLQKPVLCDANLQLFQGGTRMMAVSRNKHIQTVGVLCSCEQTKEFNKNWVEVIDKNHLANILNIDIKEIIMLYENWHDHLLDWIEFSLLSSSNHMHNETLRWNQITNYLNNQSSDFRFSLSWLDTEIDWSTWDNLDGH